MSGIRRCAALLALLAVAPGTASGAVEPEHLYEGARLDDVIEALYAECYQAGMAAQLLGRDIVVCTAAVTGDERVLDGMVLIDVHGGHVLHRVRFALAERPQGVRVWAYPWIEVEESDGRLFDEAIDSEEYLRRLREVLVGIETALAADAAASPPPWARYYETQDDWRLDAHLRAVAHCDRILEQVNPALLERQMREAGLRPLGRTVRDRCEELHEEVFRWALARGLEDPDVEAYLEHRAALPPEDRVCTGRLALAAPC